MCVGGFWLILRVLLVFERQRKYGHRELFIRTRKGNWRKFSKGIFKTRIFTPVYIWCFPNVLLINTVSTITVRYLIWFRNIRKSLGSEWMLIEDFAVRYYVLRWILVEIREVFICTGLFTYEGNKGWFQLDTHTVHNLTLRHFLKRFSKWALQTFVLSC